MEKELKMKRITALFLLPAFFLSLAVNAAEDRGKNDKNEKKREGGGVQSKATARQPVAARTARPLSTRAARSGTARPPATRQPMVIRMNRPTNSSQVQPVQQPSYGQTQWNRSTQTRPKASSAPAPGNQPTRQLPAVKVPGARMANVVHHHPYTQGYVRKKLIKIGVKTEPSRITNRSEIVSTDRAHSTISYPRTGFKGETIKGSLVSPRKLNNSAVRAQMAFINRPAYMNQLALEIRVETQRNHTYWHSDNGFNYGHYIDNSGYHWYGWYRGDQYFWTRNYNGRWWWYDTGFNRWCFYNDNYWWWQDPYHVGDLYVYDNDNYIPANSADDQIVVAGPEGSDDLVYNSPDGQRQLKVTNGEGDAFLYDRNVPSAFDPIYLASNVQSVQFSDTSNGRPLEVILKLNDGSYDMFDDQGNPYNAGSEY